MISLFLELILIWLVITYLLFLNIDLLNFIIRKCPPLPTSSKTIKSVLAIIGRYETKTFFRKKVKNIIPLIKEIKADGLGLEYHLVDEKIIKDCHKENLEINAWTVNEIEDIERMIKLEVDIISSNYPNKVLEKLKSKNAKN